MSCLSHKSVGEGYILRLSYYYSKCSLTSLISHAICIRRVPAQDVLFALIFWYVAKTIFRS